MQIDHLGRGLCLKSLSNGTVTVQIRREQPGEPMVDAWEVQAEREVDIRQLADCVLTLLKSAPVAALATTTKAKRKR